MKKKIGIVLVVFLTLFIVIGLTACGKEVDFSINFIVDGEQYATVSTAGNETITMPENPTKGNYSFDGWYWDKDIWNTPFTANSLLDAPLSSDMSVYAKFTHNHDDSDWKIVSTVASTEETEGSITYSCTVCGATKTEIIERLPHVHVYSEEWEKNETHHWHECAKDGDKSGYALHEWSSGTIIKEATEDETGTKLYTCTVCGATKTEPVDKLPHTHKYSDVWTNDETYHWHSATCGHDVVSDKEMHNWNDGVITKEATEDETGTKLFTCTACGAMKTEIIERLPHVHVYSQEWEKNETHHWHECAKDGDKSGYALHEWNSGTITKEATEDETGTKLYTCTVCGATKTEIIERLPHVHVYSEEWKKDETHHWHECAKDGARNNFENHTYDNGVISKEATEFEYGKIKYTCTVCGYFYEENTPKLVIDRSGAEIVTAKGFTMNGNIGNISLPNTTETYSFINQITVSDYATWVISTDIYGMNTVVTKTIPLTVGDNTVYLLVSSGDGNNISLYTMTVRRRPMYSVDFVTNGGTSVESQTIEETYLATEPTTTRIGYTFTGWDYDFTRPILKNETVSASWTANTNTAYKVEYYLQNLEDNGYTLDHTDNLTGTTDTTANAEIKSYNHFTYNQSKSIVRGNINGNGSRVLKVYYTRDKYAYSVTNENVKGGSITCTANGGYKFDAIITLTTSINAGYDFLGWYVGYTRISEDVNYSFHIEQPIAITAKWYAHENTAYKVEYYLQNLEDDDYTLDRTDNLTGTTDTTANAEIKAYEHFTFIENNSVLSGNIDGDGSRVLKVYYLRNQYHIVISSNKNVTITNEINGTYKYGQIINGSSANIYLGYEWSGWTLNNNFLTMETGIEEFVCERDMTYIAKCNPKQEMMNFTFSSTLSTCTITGIKDKSVTDIIVPDYVTNINSGAFSGCSSLQSITIPFVGNRAGVTSSDTYQYPFGYIFGTSSYTGGTATKQYYYGSSTSSRTNTTYYIPSNLKSVTVTGGNIFNAFSGCSNLTSITLGNSVTSIGSGAFGGCSSLTSITIPESVTSIGNSAFSSCSSLTSVTIGDGVKSIGSYAFYDCSKLTSITIPDGVTRIGDYAFSGCSSLTSVYYTGDIASWCGISFGSNPLYYAHNLYIDNELIKDIVIPDTVTEIGYQFTGWNGTSITIPDSVTSIGEEAFYNCICLTSITIPDSVTRIGEGAFSGCSSLQSITIPFVGNRAGVTSSDTYQYPFGYIFGTNSYTGGTATGQSYYGSSTSYTNDITYYIPSTLKSVTVTGGNILYNAFRNCSNLTSITIPDSVTDIARYAFKNCSSLTSITIPDSVTSIGNSAFEDCYHLVEVYNKSSLNITKGSEENGYVGYYAKAIYTEEYTSKLSTDSNGYLIYTDGEEKSLIMYTGEETELTLPEGITEIYQYAFYENNKITSITIPDSVTSIGDYAFRGCRSLTSVYYKGDIASWCGITFNGDYYYSASNPLYYAHNLYINNEIISGEIVLPNTVTKIPGYTFRNSQITSITIPDSVTSIGSGAFNNCPIETATIPTLAISYIPKSNLKTVVITSGESIGEYAFRDCSSLTSITIPDSVTSIGEDAFYNCSSLTSVYYTSDIASWCGITFGNDYSNPLRYAHNLYIDNEIISGEIVLPNTVTKIPDYTFKNSNITSITIPASITRIESSAFSGCSKLTSIIIPDSVTSIGNYVFENCISLTSVYYTGDMVSWCGISFGSNPLYYAHNLYIDNELIKDIVIPDTVTEIKARVFDGWNGTSITIPDSVTSIGDYAFSNCSSLQYNEYDNGYYLGNDNNPYLWLIKARYTNITSRTIHENTKFIHSYAFSWCSSLTSITIPDSVTSIGDSAFSNCSNLTSVTIGNSVTSIGGSAFHYCRSLKSITIPDSVTSIGERAFFGCSSLTSITIGNSVTSIGERAFYECSSLTSITISDSVTSIGDDAFYNCSSLTSITIPDSVTSIGDDAFSNCSSLTSITFQGAKARWNAIRKGNWWNDKTGSYTVYCTDGTLKK